MSKCKYKKLSLALFFIGLIVLVIRCSKNDESPSVTYNNLPVFIPEGKIFLRSQTTEIGKIFNIPLAKDLEYNKKASSELINICEKYDGFVYHTKKEREFHDKEFESKWTTWYFNIEEYNDLIRIIQKYPKSTAALTAKLRIAFVTGIQVKESYKYLINMLEEIRKDYLNTWQSIYAIKKIGHLAFNYTPSEELQPLIDYHLQHIGEYQKLDTEKDPEFIQLKKAKQRHWEDGEEFKNGSVFSAGILLSISCWAGDCLKDYEQGIRLSERIVKEYPETIEEWEAQGYIKDYRCSIQSSKLYKWFTQTYRRRWTGTEISKLNKFRDQFEKQHKRKPNLEEEQEFLKKLMSDSGSKQNEKQKEKDSNSE